MTRPPQGPPPAIFHLNVELWPVLSPDDPTEIIIWEDPMANIKVEGSGEPPAPEAPRCRIARVSRDNFNRLHKLHHNTPLIIFNPKIAPQGKPPKPEGEGSIKAEQDPKEVDPEQLNLFNDPFEPFGRTLCRYHRYVLQLTYRGERGFLPDHHGQYVKQAGVYVVVLCEPLHGNVHASMAEQLLFAESLYESMLSYNANPDTELIVVQCAREYCRVNLPARFANVIETDKYTDEIGRAIADTMFLS